MQCFLSSRPKQFSTPQQAIEYMVRSGQVRNVESARVSIIGQIQPIVTTQSNTTDSSTIPAVSHLCETVREEDEEEEEEDGEDKPSVHISQSPPPPTTATNVSDNTNKYTWRIDLSKTEQFWQGWFSGLSELFLSCECPKLLLLAGVDRLDRDLTVGQMQGKFQMHVIPKSGHAVHEDAPEQVADCIASFLVRHKLVQPVDENFHGTLPGC
jgi:protein phosphatase methylesterase 1